jgi:sugar phosphate permease
VQAQPTKEGGFRWVVLTLIFLVYMIAGADRANIGVVVPVIRDEFKLSNTDIGAMSSLFYIGYALIQIPAGAFYSRFGIRKLFNLSIVLTSLATFLMGLTANAFQLKAARVVLGLSEGPLNIGCVSLINRWFPPQERGLAAGVFMASIKLAPALVPPVCAFIILTLGWRQIFWFFAIPGFVIAALFYLLVRDNPDDSPLCTPSEAAYIARDMAAKADAGAGGAAPHWIDRLIRSRTVEPMDDHRAITLSWNIWGCAIGYGCLVGIAYAIMTWVPTYLVTVKHFSIMKMGFVAAAPWVGAIIGNIVGGWMSDKLFDRRRKPVMMLTSASTIVMMYTLLYAPNEPVTLALLLLVAGVFLNLGYSTFLVYPMGIASRRTSSYAISIVNMCGSLGGAFAPFVVGVILDSFNWDSVFLFLAVCSLITLMVLFTIIEPRPRGQN